MKTIQTIRLIILVFVSLTMNLYGRESQTKASEAKASKIAGGRELEIIVHGRPESSSFQWKICSPSEQGLNSDKLTELVYLIREGKRYPRIQSFLIVRHGCLVVEEYVNNWKAERLHILQSVTKSFTSALIGMAIARGEIQGVDEKILDFDPDMEGIAHMDERARPPYA